MSIFQACCSAPKMEVLTSAPNHGTSYVNFSPEPTEDDMKAMAWEHGDFAVLGDLRWFHSI